MFVSLLCKDIRTPIIDVYPDGFCFGVLFFVCFGGFFSLEGSLDVVI